MKKRILAIVLACLMLVSVLPTSAFAVEHNHDAAEYKCPGVGKEHAHNTQEGKEYQNCDAIVLEKVAPQCGGMGYTLYQCLGCGVKFVSDTIMGEGDHNYGDLIPAVPYSCKPGEEKNGVYAHYHCEDCDTYFNENKVIVAEEKLVWEWGHNPVAIEGEDIDCTKGNRVCADCGTLLEPMDSHKWSTLEITTWPTPWSNGVATEICLNDGCDVTRTIEIEKQCLHGVEDLTWVEAKEPTCTEGGWIAHYECPLCYEATGKIVYLLANKVGQVYETVASAVLRNKLGHAWSIDTVVEADCFADGSTKDGYTSWVCDRCDATKVTDEVDGTHVLEQLDYSKPNCQEYGAIHYLCKKCGYIEQQGVDKLPHYTFEEVQANGGKWTYTPPTCSTPGLKTWYCNRTWETYDDEGNVNGTKTCNEYHTLEVAVVGCSYLTLTYENSCIDDGWSLEYCTYADCKHNEWATEVEWIIDGVKTTFAIADLLEEYNARYGTSYTLTDEEKGVHLTGSHYLGMYECGHGQYGHDSTCKNKHNWESTVLNQPSCTTSGSIGHICQDCGAYWHEEIMLNGQGHDMTFDASWTGPNGEKDVDTDSTCAVHGVKTTYCKGYDIYEYDNENDKLVVVGHQYCGLNAAGRRLYDNYYEETEKDLITFDPVNQIYNWLYRNEERDDEANLAGKGLWLIHECLKDIDLVDAGKTPVADGKYHLQVGGDCDTMAIYYIWCEDCQMGLFVTDGTTGGQQHKWTVTDPGTPATCFEPGMGQTRTCSVCGEVEEGKEIPRLHDQKGYVTHWTKQEVSCGVKGWEEHWTCSCTGTVVAYDNANATADDVLTEEEHAALHYAAISHSYVLHCERPADCLNYGYRHEVCANCGDHKAEFMRALGHIIQAATCENDAYCSRGNCTHIVIGSALGHKNAAGETLSRDCLDYPKDENGKLLIPKDLECVNGKSCDCWVEYDAEKKAETGREGIALVIVEHDMENVYRVWNCIEYKCYIDVCKKCGYQEKVEEKDNYGDHDYQPIEGVASYVSQATEMCIHCGDIRTNAWTGFQVFLNAENANGSGFKYVDSSLIKVGISVASIKQVGIHTLVYEMTYDARNFYFEGSSMYDADGNLTLPEGFAGGDIWNRVVDGVGYVRIVLVADNNSEDGSYENFIIPALDENGKGLNLVDVYLRAWLEEDVRALWENPRSIAKFAHHTAFATNEVSAVNVEGKSVACAGSDVEVDIYPLLDTDRTWTFEPTDIWYAYMILDKAVKENGEAFEYHVAADVDKDGEITMTDLYYIYKYATHEIDYETLRSVGV